MTDEQRFQLDEELRAKYAKATADLSRFKQLASDYAEWLGRISNNLRHTPQTTQLRQATGSSAWIWTYSPMGQGLEERQLPDWSEVNEATNEIRRLGAEVEQLEQELRARKLL